MRAPRSSSDGRLVAAVNEERLTQAQARDPVSRRDRSPCAWRSPASTADSVQLVAASDHRRGQDARPAVARRPRSATTRCAAARPAPGALAALRSRAKYRITEWPPNAASRARQRAGRCARDLAPLGLGSTPLRLVRSSRPARRGGGLRQRLRVVRWSSRSTASATARRRSSAAFAAARSSRSRSPRRARRRACSSSTSRTC